MTKIRFTGKAPRAAEFGVLLADPPWKFGDKLPGKGRGAEKHYPCMNLSEIMRYPIPQMLPDSWLFLWRVAAMQDKALQVVKAWGYTVKSEIVWVKTAKRKTSDQIARAALRNALKIADCDFLDAKDRAIVRDNTTFTAGLAAELAFQQSNRVQIGMGRTVRNAHEILLVCTRGKPVVYDHSVLSVIHAPRGEHSSKPEEVQDAIDKLVGPVLKAELFARRHRPGWACFGNALDAAQAAE